MTCAIAARCEKTGRFGVAMSTRPIGVGARCPFFAPNFGVVVTMAYTDPRLGPLGTGLLKAGYSAGKVLAEHERLRKVEALADQAMRDLYEYVERLADRYELEASTRAIVEELWSNVRAKVVEVLAGDEGVEIAKRVMKRAAKIELGI